MNISNRAPLLVVVAGFLITVFTYQYKVGIEQQQRQSLMALAATEQRAHLQNHVDNTVEILDSIASYVTYSKQINRADFHSFTQPVIQRHSELYALHWIPRVLDEDRALFEQLLLEQGFNSGITAVKSEANGLVKAPESEVYYPVLYSEPLALNNSVIGLDAYSRNLNAEVIDQLLDGSAKFLSSAPFHLVQDEMASSSVVFFRPVYYVAPTQEALVLRGFIAAVVKPQRLIDKQVMGHDIVAMKLDDVTSENSVEIASMGSIPTDINKTSYVSEFRVLGRSWALRVWNGKSQHLDGYRVEYWILFFGFLFTFFSAMGLSRLKVSHRQVLLERDKAQSYLDTVDTIMLALDQRGEITMINRKGSEVLGYTPADLLGKNWFSEDFVIDSIEEKKGFNLFINSSSADSDLYLSESKIRARNDQIRLITWRNKRRTDQSGDVVGMLCSGSDITEQRHNERLDKLRSSAMEAALRGESLSYVLNLVLTGIEEQYPGALCSILLLDKTGKHLLNCAAPSLPKDYQNAIHGIEIGEGVGSCGTAAFRRERVIVEDIETHPFWASFKDLALSHNLGSCWSEPIFGKKHRLKGTFAIYHQEPSLPSDEDLELITSMAAFVSMLIEEFQVEEALVQMANTDALTGLNNRRKLLASLEEEFARTKRYGRHFSLCMLDLDHFKMVNDQYGHDAGDLVLKAISEIITQELRESDISGRIGGEEFALLLPDTELHKAGELSERLRLKIEQFTVKLRTGESVKLTASIGVAEYASSMELSTDMLGLADKRLYWAKDNGRNQISIEP
ncbi:diguanylate cyclase [Amphritea sp.]|uniref:sensor domain-containing diguanylate cyclase n=1 Tax=Amphritea sp. TaxID=1872502 RepID=UPI0025C70A2D|nr:diguanylate cyclase [Amphritea sp.]